MMYFCATGINDALAPANSVKCSTKQQFQEPFTDAYDELAARI